jgi:hypothetical protein
MEDEFGCGSEMPDGFMDLVLKFSTQEIVAALGPVEDGDVVILTLIASSEDPPIMWQEAITILKRGRIRVDDGDLEERRDNGNHYGWTNGNGNAYGRERNLDPMSGRGRSVNGEHGGDSNLGEGEEAGNRGNGKAHGREKDKEKGNGKDNGSDKGNGNKNGHNKGGD